MNMNTILNSCIHLLAIEIACLNGALNYVPPPPNGILKLTYDGFLFYWKMVEVEANLIMLILKAYSRFNFFIEFTASISALIASCHDFPPIDPD